MTDVTYFVLCLSIKRALDRISRFILVYVVILSFTLQSRVTMLRQLQSMMPIRSPIATLCNHVHNPTVNKTNEAFILFKNAKNIYFLNLGASVLAARIAGLLSFGAFVLRGFCPRPIKYTWGTII